MPGPLLNLQSANPSPLNGPSVAFPEGSIRLDKVYEPGSAEIGKDLLSHVPDISTFLRQEALNKDIFLGKLDEMLASEGHQASARQLFQANKAGVVWGGRPVIVLENYSNEEGQGDFLRGVGNTTRYSMIPGNAWKPLSEVGNVVTNYLPLDSRAVNLLKTHGTSDLALKNWSENYLRIADTASHGYIDQLLNTETIGENGFLPYFVQKRMVPGLTAPQPYSITHDVDHKLSVHAQVLKAVFDESPERKEIVLGRAAESYEQLRHMQQSALAHASTEVERAQINEAITYLAEIHSHQLFSVFSPDDPALKEVVPVKTPEGTRRISVADAMGGLTLATPERLRPQYSSDLPKGLELLALHAKEESGDLYKAIHTLTCFHLAPKAEIDRVQDEYFASFRNSAAKPEALIHTIVSKSAMDILADTYEATAGKLSPLFRTEGELRAAMALAASRQHGEGNIPELRMNSSALRKSEMSLPATDPAIDGERIVRPSVLSASVMDGHVDLTYVPKSATAMKLKFGDGFRPAPQELALIHDFREHAFIAARKTGAAFDMLVVSPGDTGSSMAVNRSGKGFVLKTNIQTLVEAKEAGIDLEGSIRHEAGHALYNHFDLRFNLERLAGAAETLNTIHTGFKADPEATKKIIVENFGSIEDFAFYAHQFQCSVMPVVNEMMSKQELISASPEQMARWMETDDEAYKWFKKNARALSSESAILYNLSEFNPKPSISAAQMGNEHPFVHFLKQAHEGLSLQIAKNIVQPLAQHISATMKKRLEVAFGHEEVDLEQQLAVTSELQPEAIRKLSWSFQNGEEYAVDRFAVETAENKRALTDDFRAIHSKEESSYRDWHTTSLDDGGPNHPSNPQRILRMEAIHQGIMPDDNVLREFKPFTNASSVGLGAVISIYPEGHTNIALPPGARLQLKSEGSADASHPNKREAVPEYIRVMPAHETHPTPSEPSHPLAKLAGVAAAAAGAASHIHMGHTALAAGGSIGLVTGVKGVIDKIQGTNSDYHNDERAGGERAHLAHAGIAVDVANMAAGVAQTAHQFLRQSKISLSFAEATNIAKVAPKGLGALGEFAGPVGLGLTVASGAIDTKAAMDAHDGYRAAQSAGGAAGALAGGIAGAEAGALVGSVVPIAGTAIGGIVGGIGGAMLGNWLGGKATDAAVGNAWDIKLHKQDTAKTSSSHAKEPAIAQADDAFRKNEQHKKALSEAKLAAAQVHHTDGQAAFFPAKRQEAAISKS